MTLNELSPNSKLLMLVSRVPSGVAALEKPFPESAELSRFLNSKILSQTQTHPYELRPIEELLLNGRGEKMLCTAAVSPGLR